MGGAEAVANFLFGIGGSGSFDAFWSEFKDRKCKANENYDIDVCRIVTTYSKSKGHGAKLKPLNYQKE